MQSHGVMLLDLWDARRWSRSERRCYLSRRSAGSQASLCALLLNLDDVCIPRHSSRGSRRACQRGPPACMRRASTGCQRRRSGGARAPQHAAFGPFGLVGIPAEQSFAMDGADIFRGRHSAWMTFSQPLSASRGLQGRQLNWSLLVANSDPGRGRLLMNWVMILQRCRRAS